MAPLRTRRSERTVVGAGAIGAAHAWALGLAIALATVASGASAPPVQAAAAPAIGSPWIETRSVRSRALGREMPYVVYLPPDYTSSAPTRYPVLYMLHGMGGSNSEWMGYGLLGEADRMVRAGELAPLVIVLPQGDQGDWIDQVDGPQWATYVARDVVDEVDRIVRTRPEREHRAVGGLSMGATGALQLAIRFPDVFGVVGAHTPTLRDWAGQVEYLGPEMAAQYFGDERSYAERDPVDLFRARPAAAARLTIWLDAGAEDASWLAPTEAFHLQLDEEGIAHEWRVLPGDHSGDRYWRPHAPEYLRFYGRVLGGPVSSYPAASNVY